mgnify:CR=1 FL=1
MLGSSKPIGIFDSGIGGLTIAKTIKEVLPDERIVYFGDTVHLPYGDKSSQSIKKYAQEITEFLIANDCKAVVVACNSASTVASKVLEKRFGKETPIINVIDPTVKLVASSKAAKKIGLIGTKKTVGSGVYAKRLKAKNSSQELFSKATPLLAPMIEEGFYNNTISKTIIHAYLSSKHLADIDTLILGCTHYPLIKSEIEDFYKKPKFIIDSSIVTANELKRVLEEKGIVNKTPNKEPDLFYISDYTLGFEKAAKQFFGKSIKLQESRIFG